MKKPKGPRFAGEIGEQLRETAKRGGEQASLGKAFEDLLKQIFGGVKPLSPEEKKVLVEKEKQLAREARAQVLEPFMPTPDQERAYYQKQKEEVAKKMEERKKFEKKAWEETAQVPKGRKKVGSLFEFLRRKVTHTERKVGDKF